MAPKYKSRKRTFKRKASTTKGKCSTKKLCKEVSHIERQVKRLQADTDIKFGYPVYFTIGNGTPATTTLAWANPYVLLVNPLNRGTNFNVRVADTAMMNSINVSGQIYVTTPSNIGGINTAVRLMLVKMLKPKGQAMVLSATGNIAGQTALFAVGTSASANPYTWSQTDTGVLTSAYRQYKILYDKTHHLVSQSSWYDGTHAQNVNPFFNFHIKKKLGFKTDYSRGNSGNITDIEANALYLIAITDTTQTLTLEMDLKFYFTG